MYKPNSQHTKDIMHFSGNIESYLHINDPNGLKFQYDLNKGPLIHCVIHSCDRFITQPLLEFVIKQL